MAKDNKTSKTARVMNLLSKKNDPAAAANDAPLPRPQLLSLPSSPPWPPTPLSP